MEKNPKIAIVAPFSTRAAHSYRIWNMQKHVKADRVIFYAQDRYGKSERKENVELLWWKKSIWIAKLHGMQIAWKAKDCDIVYFFKPILANVCAAFWLRLMGKKVVFDFDEWEPYTQEEYGKRRRLVNLFVTTLFAWLSWLAVKLAHAYTCANKRIPELLPERKHLVLPNGVDMADYPKRKFELKKIVCYAGSLHYADMILPFLLPVPSDFEVWIYGEGEGREKIRDALENAGIRAKFFGYVQPEKFASELKKCRGIFVAPYPALKNIAYSSSGKMPQYMALGQPIIVSNVEGPLDFLAGKDCAWLVEPGYEKKIRETVNEIWKNKALAAKKAVLAYEVVKRNFDWGDMGPRLKQFLVNL